MIISKVIQSFLIQFSSEINSILAESAINIKYAAHVITLQIKCSGNSGKSYFVLSQDLFGSRMKF